MKKNYNGFTLIEVLLGILIFSIVIIGGFQALSAVTLGKIKLVEKTDITKDAFYFSEKMFEEIKAGGTIDYEEYFNRKVVGTSFSSGHYSTETGFGNYGSGGSVGTASYGDSFYFCRSGTSDAFNMGSGTINPEGGCFGSGSFNTSGNSFLGKPERYGQYAFQFIDYNSNYDGDNGDEDGNGNIRGDDDDEHLGMGPVAFTGGTDVKEIYLVSGDGKKRTLFRWNWKIDPKKPASAPCTNTTFGSGCLGTVEFLKLDGKDWGVNHSSGTTSTGSFDGIIDTWIVDKNFSGGAEVIAGSGNYWQPLFPDSVNVSNFQVYMYPNSDIKNSWKDNTASSNINPYLRLVLTLEPSRKKRAAMKGIAPKIKLNTTINLTDYFTK